MSYQYIVIMQKVNCVLEYSKSANKSFRDFDSQVVGLQTKMYSFPINTHLITIFVHISTISMYDNMAGRYKLRRSSYVYIMFINIHVSKWKIVCYAPESDIWSFANRNPYSNYVFIIQNIIYCFVICLYNQLVPTHFIWKRVLHTTFCLFYYFSFLEL